MLIQVLPDDVVSQIAAGEVVERPASVVKELVENAIDAGADAIQVVVTGDGRRKMQISDNGSGILSDEIELAFSRHATSKLRSADDLFNIHTLGFRGEALASIASVSQMSVTTRHESEPMGTELRLEGSALRQRRAVGAPAGTVMTIENLFFNTPARLKFLKAESTEKRQIANVVMRYALAYPHVRFVLVQDGREIFRTHGSGQLVDVIATVLGLDTLKNMIEVQDDAGEHAEIHVWGFTSAPNLNRADRSRIHLFVNGRWIQDTSLTYAVVQAYHTLLMGGRYPIAVLMIRIPAEDVDVNVHPTKAEVRFRDADRVFAAVQRAVRRSIIDHVQIPSLRHYASASTTREAGWGDQQMHLGLPLTETGQHARQRTGASEYYDPSAIPEGAGAPQQPRTLPMLRVVGQIGASYIVAEGPAGMYLIDQHAAHERILYEQFMAEHERQIPAAQHTLEAQTVQLSPGEAQLLEANLDVLEGLGFALEPFGPGTFVIRSIPAMLSERDPVQVIIEIVSDLEQGLKPGQQAIEDKIILRVCKQAAVKAGQVLSSEQMQGLIRQLERCQSPLTCPHGRPTMIHMSQDRLEREFGRTV